MTPTMLDVFLKGLAATPRSLPAPEVREEILRKHTELIEALEAHQAWTPPSPHKGLFHVWDFVNRSKYIMTELDNIQAGRPVQHPDQIPRNERGELFFVTPPVQASRALRTFIPNPPTQLHQQRSTVLPLHGCPSRFSWQLYSLNSVNYSLYIPSDTLTEPMLPLTQPPPRLTPPSSPSRTSALGPSPSTR